MERQHFPVCAGDGIQLLGKLLLQFGVLGDAQQGRTCAGQAEGCAGGAHQILDGFVVGDQLLTVVLVELILHGIAQQLFVALFQRFQNQRAMGDVVDGIGAADLLRQGGSGLGGGQVEVGNQSEELPVGMQGKADGNRESVIHHGGGQAAEEGGGKVIGVAFHSVGDVQKTLRGQLIAAQNVGTHGTCDQKCGGRAETAADGNVCVNVNFDTAQFFAHGGQRSAVGNIGEVIRAGEFLGAAGDFKAAICFFEGDIGIQAQGAAKSVKTGAEIGGGRRHTNGYSFHIFLLTVPARSSAFRLIDDTGVALLLTAEGGEIDRHRNAGDVTQTFHLVEFVAGQVAADGFQYRGGELVGGCSGQNHHGAVVAGFTDIFLSHGPAGSGVGIAQILLLLPDLADGGGGLRIIAAACPEFSGNGGLHGIGNGVETFRIQLLHKTGDKRAITAAHEIQQTLQIGGHQNVHGGGGGL